MNRPTTLFWIVTAATIGWMLLMRLFTPPEIIQFEFARTVETASRMLATWGADGIEKVKLSLYLDFIFLILYCWSISLGCKVSAGFGGQNFMKPGLLFSKIIWIAGACDIIENVALLFTIQNPNNAVLELAFWMAGIKFTIVVAAILMMLAGTVAGLIRVIGNFWKSA